MIVKLVRGKSSAHSERTKQKWAHRKQTYQDSVEVYSAWSDWVLYVKNNRRDSKKFDVEFPAEIFNPLSLNKWFKIVCYNI